MLLFTILISYKIIYKVTIESFKKFTGRIYTYRTHDLVMVNHVNIRQQIERVGVQNMRYSKSEHIEKFTQVSGIFFHIYFDT